MAGRRGEWLTWAPREHTVPESHILPLCRSLDPLPVIYDSPWRSVPLHALTHALIIALS